MMKVYMMIIFSMIMIYFSGVLSFYISLCFFLSFMIMLMFSVSTGGDWGCMVGVSSVVDCYSYFMILMSVWVIGLMYMSLYNEFFVDKVKLMMFMVSLFVLVWFFSTMNLMVMYFFFEVSLIPTFFIVIFWGVNYERLEASFYLIMYMMFISFPLLVYIMKIYQLNLTFDMMILSVMGFNKYSMVMGGLDYFILFMAFFIKLPVYLMHVWLPKAHVEAPVYGSMLLAAILLKLGGYGLLRLIEMFLEKSLEVSYLVLSLGMIGAVYVSIHCLMQVDMKSLVAYSSVVHMNFMLCSFYSLMKMGVFSGFLMMISHGLCSSGLFYMVNMYYSRTHSRLIFLNKSSLSFVPSSGLWWFLLCSSNFSFPFSLNFLGEIIMIMTLLNWSMGLIFCIALVGFFSGAYSLYLFSMILHGGSSVDWSISMNKKYLNSVMVEHLSLFLHYMPLLLLMLNMTVFLGK